MSLTHTRVDSDDLVRIETERPGDLDRQAMSPDEPAVRFAISYETRPAADAVPHMQKSIVSSSPWSEVEEYVTKLLLVSPLTVITAINRIVEEPVAMWQEKIGQYTRHHEPFANG